MRGFYCSYEAAARLIAGASLRVMTSALPASGARVQHTQAGLEMNTGHSIKLDGNAPLSIESCICIVNPKLHALIRTDLQNSYMNG